MASHFDEARDKLNTGEKGGRVGMLMLQFGVGDVPSTKRGRLRRCGLSTVGRGFSRASELFRYLCDSSQQSAIENSTNA